MAKLKTVELTMITGTKVYVPLGEFNLGGVPETPDSVIGNYIKGSRAPMLRVYATAELTGDYFFVNPKMIVSMTPSYA
ncbi:hypothetical protein Bcp1_065 [Bacillus phage Bcp1]|uniref:Uncharacterized protein n=3 Tax=Caeruleovirus TaxID=1911929 RepID=A0A0S2MUE9_9CAUD|nr:hypothetical protein Bcp1_065 [Bacillus phage Bcp1]YP_009626626.1 hypothetical protein FD732_gp060 [Bacillus phage BM15]AXQ66840.1 hypothetical protein HOBO_60 [Bacillus phage Hobo]AXQ67736.1 hypothetical protein KIOSHI_60 [Bacillus phage Kioshi]AHN66542.1 hypothetical protein Bcp1_065 [Bacillus phage Bcp1]ALO79481.1 hypothetical protein BM10_60 [Bacillus phage BM15]